MFKKDPRIAYWLEENLYLNITNRCSNNCYFCLRNFSDGVGGFNLKLNKEPSVAEIISGLQEIINRKNWNEIVFCGFGEPLKRLNCILEVTRWIRKNFGKNAIIRVDTNGHGRLLNKNRNVIKELKEAGIDKLRVSVNAQNEQIYNKICRPKITNAFAATLEFSKKAKKSIDVEITAVAVPEANLSEIRKIARNLGLKFKIRKYISYSE